MCVRASAPARRAGGGPCARRRVLSSSRAPRIGKSSTAGLCEARDGELVSADSVQLYRGLDVGSNKPSPAELKRVRHHLVDVADASNPWSAGAWCAAAASDGDVGETRKTPCRRRRHDDVRPVAGAGRAGRAEGVRYGSGLGSRFLAPHGDDWERLERGRGAFGSVRARVAKLSQNDFYRLSRALEIELDREAGGGVGSAPAGPGKRF